MSYLLQVKNTRYLTSKGPQRDVLSLKILTGDNGLYARIGASYGRKKFQARPRKQDLGRMRTSERDEAQSVTCERDGRRANSKLLRNAPVVFKWSSPQPGSFAMNGAKIYLGFHQFSSYFPSRRFVYEFSKLGNLTPVKVIIEIERPR